MDSLLNLTGKTALITGASKGIGQAIAELYAAAGVHVIVSSRKQEAVEAVVNDLKSKGYKATAMACHVGDVEDVYKLADYCLSHFGSMDILVNNAATNPVFGQVVDTDATAFDKIMAVNVKGFFELSKKLYPTGRWRFYDLVYLKKLLNLLPPKPNPMKAIVVLILIVHISGSLSAQTWTGGTAGSWLTIGNWSTGAVPTSSDNVTFNSGGSINVTDIPTQSIANLLITNNTSVSFTPGAANQTLTINNNTGDDVVIASGSSLTLVQVSNKINVTVGGGGSANISGSLTLQDSNFDIGNGTLILRDNATLARTVGQITLGTASTLQFGTAGSSDTGPQIVLPNSILAASPTQIGTLIVNRANGASLGDQTILTTTLTLTLGDLVTNGAGRIRINNLGSNPVESLNSKIIGYAETELNRNVGTSSPFTILGLSIFSPNNELLTLVRRTGSAGNNVFSASQSINVTWEIGLSPATSKDMQFSWVSSFDNTSIPTNTFQLYRFDGGPGWTTIGSLTSLSSTSDPRVSATITSVGTFTSSRAYTLADQNQILPVEMTEFYGKSTNTGIALAWQTASEKNNAFFQIEKMNSDRTFQVIGKVDGAGTTLVQQSYSFVDEKPRIGDNYYRLKQVDVDGAFAYSNVIHVAYDGKPTMRYAVYPNPTNGKSLFFDNATEDFSVSLSDFSGNVIFSAKVPALNPSIDTSSMQLASGFYFVRTSDSQGSQVQKLIVK